MSVPDFYRGYIDNFQGDTLIKGMILSGDEALDFYKSLGPGVYDFRYVAGKWSVREILGHIIDTERVFSYRALRFARGDETPLPGFDQDLWIPNMNIERRTMNYLVSEFAGLRASTIDLFSSFGEEVYGSIGTASGGKFTVEQVGKILVGHEIHHRKIIKERYLNN